MKKLLPFVPISEELFLKGALVLEGGLLRLRFELQDASHALQDGLEAGNWSSSALLAARADELWKTTCFEAFWGVPGSGAYWELNISGSGKWNLYRFKSYRSPQQPCMSEDFSFEALTTHSLGLEALLKPKIELQGLEASLCAVMRTLSGLHYFSTKHAGAKPDFHLRDSFLIKL